MRYLLTFLMLFTVLTAAENRTIDTMIDEIIHAPQEERYEKMNAFKRKMRELNQQQRSEALSALRARMHADTTAPSKAAATAGMQQQQQQQMQQRQMRMQQQQMQQMQQQMQQYMPPPQMPPHMPQPKTS